MRNPPAVFDNRYLKSITPEIEEDEEDEGVTVTESITPYELMERGYHRIKGEIETEILNKIVESSPAKFERIVVDMLLGMGYGGSRKDAGRALGKVGDEGIDGIIKEDILGLDIIYIQAKNWKAKVGRPEVQTFAGALQGKRAKRGIYITTSEFTPDAQDYVKGIDAKIVLIDGREMARLMIEYNVGVNVGEKFEVKKLDNDYFSDEA